MPYYRTAFLLDDDPAALFLVEDVLTDLQIAHAIYGYTRYTDLLSAFKRLADSPQPEGVLPDLLLLDVNMPGRDGLEVLEAIQQIPGIGGSKVCVFLLSTFFPPLLEQKLKHYPISGYFTKPVEGDAIGQLIRSAQQDECELQETSLSSR